MKQAAVILLSCWLCACTSVHTPEGHYTTFGRAEISECQQMVFPEGQGPGKEAIGFNCKHYQSDGLSGEAVALGMAIVNVIPGLEWLLGLGK